METLIKEFHSLELKYKACQNELFQQLKEAKRTFDEKNEKLKYQMRQDEEKFRIAVEKEFPIIWKCESDINDRKYQLFFTKQAALQSNIFRAEIDPVETNRVSTDVLYICLCEKKTIQGKFKKIDASSKMDQEIESR